MTRDTILVTSGPTRAYLDRVRYIANESTGALGARIVETLIRHGIPVRHLIGAGAISPSVSESPILESVSVTTIDDLIGAVRTAAATGRIRAVVHAMAVLDYIPEEDANGKRSSGTEYWDVRLVRTPKITSLIRELMPDIPVIGFKLEAGISEEELVSRALCSLRTHGLDLVVANDLDHVGSERHEAIFVAPDGTVIARASSKEEIAAKIAEFLLRNGVSR